MAISSMELRSHFKNSSEAQYLYSFALDAGFLKDRIGYKDDEVERALYALNVANVLHLSDIDEFVKNNIERLESFYLKIIEQKGNGWTATFPFIYQLMVIFKEPSVFTKDYQTKCGLDSGMAEIIYNAQKSA